MTKHYPATAFRGIRSVRADAVGATAVLNELKTTFEAFKAEHTAELAALRKDVVQTEKVDRINADISRLTKELEAINAAITAAKIGTGHNALTDAAKTEYATAFDRFMRAGEINGLHDLAVKAALTTQSKPDGGYVVPTQMEGTIDRVLATQSALRGLSRVLTVSAPTYTKLVNMGGAGYGWVGEEESRTETTTPTLRELEFNVMEIYAEPYSTQIALDDATMNLEQWLADEVSTTFAEQEGAAFISGTGVKRPRGILTYDTIANASYAWGKIGFTVTGAAAAFAATNPADAMVDLYYSLKSGYRNNASWLMSDAVMGTVRKFKDGQGNYLWNPPAGTADVPSILNKPVYTDDNMDALGANKFPVAFADFRRAYLVIDRQGIRILRNPYKVNGKVAFYTTKRVGGGVQNFEAIKLLKCSA